MILLKAWLKSYSTVGILTISNNMSPQEILKLIVKCAERAEGQMFSSSGWEGNNQINLRKFIQALNEEIEKYETNET